MAIPEAQSGLLFRYEYLWASEAAAGREQGKDRPACLIAAGRDGFVVILPITHSIPSGGSVGIEIPARVRAAVRLDDEPCWVIVSEYNFDRWPNAGLRPIPGRAGTFSYGFIPPRLFRQIKAAFVELAEKGKSAVVVR